MSNNDPRLCPMCQSLMQKQIGLGYMIIHGSNSSNDLDDVNRQIKDREERAKHLRSQATQRSHSGIGSGKGKALGGQHFEVDKKEFIQAAAKDPAMVSIAQDALKNKGTYKKEK